MYFYMVYSLIYKYLYYFKYLLNEIFTHVVLRSCVSCYNENVRPLIIYIFFNMRLLTVFCYSHF